MILKNLKETLSFIQSKSSVRPLIGITLGSGLGSFSKMIQVEMAIPYSDIPHFFPPSVEGHSGQLLLGTVGETPVAVLQGRVHYYEGHSMEQVTYPTRVLGQLGVKGLVLTNAAGGINPDMQPGQFMIIRDHINLTGTNPLIGPNINNLGPRFPDMSEPYDKELNKILVRLLDQKKIPYSEGVYCGVCGPTYETAAEIKYMQAIGGDAVGMSTVPETIVAKHMGLRVCGISCITNLGTGLSDETLSHDDVKKTAQRVETQFCEFLRDFVSELSSRPEFQSQK